MSKGLHLLWRSDAVLHMRCGAISDANDGRLAPYVDTRRAFLGLKPDERCAECEADLNKESGVACGI